ncbi:MAG TPA: single-stranded-DNA-specific exonuclease RecJ [Gemmatimonadaceae bacterium]|nr:single-stranded-DNA-specific exonuclease RecJ [Gemmatimonadaceae bacterium]
MTSSAVRARPRARWLLPTEPDPAVVERLQDELHLPRAICRLLAIRGYGATDDAKVYLRPRLDQLSEPSCLTDLDRAVERLVRALRDNETILVHGDYDVDGICSTTLMVRTLAALGANAVPFIPSRLHDGYDLTDAGVRAAHSAGAKLVVTCDCGTSAHGPIAALQASGVDVIVTDHHLPGGPLPSAYALLNPKRPGCASPDKDLAAVGVAFKLALALTRAVGGNENVVYNMLDLVALATIADVAPLRGENRVLVRYGLKLLNDAPRPGLRAMIRAAGLEGKALTAGRIGFILAPRLNAAGRLGSALRGVELLMTLNEQEANPIARELEELNARRQEIDRATLAQARGLVEQMDLANTYGIVLAEQGWHAGVIGIVASRIVEEFGRPTMLIALDGAEGKGSGRSISAFDLHHGLTQCADLLIRYGGHKAAAGVTIAAERVGEFAARFNEVAASQLTEDDLVPELRVDLELSLEHANEELESLLRHMEPCGIGNPSPLFVARKVKVSAAPRVVGKDGLKVTLSVNGKELVALGWGMGPRIKELELGATIDVAFRLERDEFNGRSRLQARLADFRVELN